MSDGDSPNIDNFLPFSLRDVPIARTILNGKKLKKKKFQIGRKKIFCYFR
jgi:hypothetical protein